MIMIKHILGRTLLGTLTTVSILFILTGCTDRRNLDLETPKQPGTYSTNAAQQPGSAASPAPDAPAK
jgi:hypothetical protein